MIDHSEIVGMYHRVRRVPEEGSIASAIRVHAQACGFVAYALDVHPDYVAQVIGDAARG